MVICPAAHLYLDTVLRYAAEVDEGSWNRRGEIADILPLGGGNSNMFYFHGDWLIFFKGVETTKQYPYCIYINTCEVTDWSYWHSHIEQFCRSKRSLWWTICAESDIWKLTCKPQMNLCKSNLVGKNGWLKFWTWEWIKHHSTNTLKTPWNRLY